MRFHILGVPHTVTNKDYVACAYTQKVLKFGKMMKARGHTIIHYGHEESDLECDEHVTVITNKDLDIAYGNHDWRTNFFKFSNTDHAYQTFHKNAIREVGLRKQKNDFILAFWGYGVRAVCDAHPDMIVVEPGIGYPDSQWARWRVYESYSMHAAISGVDKVRSCTQDWYHVVIPNYFDLNDFTYDDKKEDYFLYLGRVYEGKGVHIAIEMTRALGKKLIIAGQGNLESMGYKEIPDHVEMVGYAGAEKRNQLMSKAKALVIGTLYGEPFGGVVIEAMLCGTPVISTDWGAFSELNVHGHTGFRCRTFKDFIEAGKHIDVIKPINCRTWAENFSLEKVGGMYEKYFQDVLNTYEGNGWYDEKSGDLNSLYRRLPA
ncbi:RfaG Glycosyltransferase [uncultured Caudovirales phage]|uniref:RfaG Glycosyltransferase n=1 Tax=uncultured Caudovirales phage TaxID=2100421 RepID=A0A6J7WTU0_9CAUD|nr:RfaG Glycosyltransferase [uncultured Caudovirales phage]